MKYSDFDTWFSVLKVRNPSKNESIENLKDLFEECWNESSNDDEMIQKSNKFNRVITSLKIDCANMQDTLNRLEDMVS